MECACEGEGAVGEGALMIRPVHEGAIVGNGAVVCKWLVVVDGRVGGW